MFDAVQDQGEPELEAGEAERDRLGFVDVDQPGEQRVLFVEWFVLRRRARPG